MQLVVMSHRKKLLEYAVPKVFGIGNHTYYLRHLRENFVTHAGMYGLKGQAMKDLLKEIVNQVAYAPSSFEYGLATDEMKKLRRELAK